MVSISPVTTYMHLITKLKPHFPNQSPGGAIQVNILVQSWVVLWGQKKNCFHHLKCCASPCRRISRVQDQDPNTVRKFWLVFTTSKSSMRVKRVYRVSLQLSFGKNLVEILKVNERGEGMHYNNQCSHWSRAIRTSVCVWIIKSVLLNSAKFL